MVDSGQWPVVGARPRPPPAIPGRSQLEILRRLADVAIAGRGAPLSGVAVGGRRIDPPPDLPPSRGGGAQPGGHAFAPDAGPGGGPPPPSLLLPYSSLPLVFSPPPFRGEVGRGVPPPGAPASRRPRAKRERGRGLLARHAGGTPALPGGSRMSGIGKIPVRAAEPPGQPPSRPPPWKGGGEKRRGRSVDGADRTLRHRRRWTKGRIAGVPPASREARTRVRAFGPPCRRDAGAPWQFTDERDREYPRPGRSRVTPLPTSPLPGGRREDPGGRSADGAARLPVRTSRAFPNGTPDSSP